MNFCKNVNFVPSFDEEGMELKRPKKKLFTFINDFRKTIIASIMLKFFDTNKTPELVKLLPFSF